jgi:hypothetical protein
MVRYNSGLQQSIIKLHTRAYNAFNRPTFVGDNANGLHLGAALTISGTSSGKFVANPAGQVCDNFTAGC